MFNAVHVAAQHVHKVVLHKPHGIGMRSRAKVTSQREQIYLEFHAHAVQFLITGAAVRVVVVAFGVGQDGFIALAPQVEEKVVDADELLHKRVFEQQEIAGHGHNSAFLVELVPILVDAVFRRVVQFNVKSFLLNSRLERFIALGQSLGRVLECLGCGVRCENDSVDAHVDFGLEHLDRFLDRL